MLHQRQSLSAHVRLISQVNLLLIAILRAHKPVSESVVIAASHIPPSDYERIMSFHVFEEGAVYQASL